MGMPAWWGERRLGLFVHANLATVPAWSPVGQYAEWYRAHLGDDVPDVLLHPGALPEVLAHHRDRWGHVERYDDFADLLTYDRFDAEAWASIAVQAGAGYTVLVTKHHDGWTWWDAPNSTHRLTDVGPRRNVVAEYAAACERNDLVFGTYYSLLDWADERYPTSAYVDEVLHPQVVDLVERFGSSVLWGDGHWGHDADVWKTTALLDAVRAIDPDVVINDRWWARAADLPDGAPDLVRTFEYDAPDDITPGPWELTRGIGQSFGYNRAERAEDHLTGFEIVDIFTEVLAKGGNLLLNVGPSADGTVPELQSAPLGDAGTWIRRHADVIARSRPWTVWGDRSVRYLDVGGVLHAIDLDGGGQFAALRPSAGHVDSVTLVDDDRSVRWHQSDDALVVDAPPPSPDFDHDRIGVRIYRIGLDTERRPIELFPPMETEPTSLAPLLADARAGEIVQLGDGRYVGPATVPPGVILRGLGADRTTIDAPIPDGPSIVPTPPTIELGRSARLEHLTVAGRADRSDWLQPPVVVLREPFATMLGCDVAGHIEVTADDALLRAVTARSLSASRADRLAISRSTFVGNRWNVGVDLRGGDAQEVESCEFADHLWSIRVTGTTGTRLRGNRISGRWWAIHLEQADGAHVHGNSIDRTMRAVDVDGGSGSIVEGNAVGDGDSGCLVHAGAADTVVRGNRWERCRAGLIEWSATGLAHADNVCVDLRDPGATHITGP